MIVQYRFIKGVWHIICHSIRPWEEGMLDLRGESYWIVPGTLS
jgi:hypothetical protein